MRNVRGCQRIPTVLVLLSAGAVLLGACSGSGRRSAAPPPPVAPASSVAPTTLTPATTGVTTRVTTTTETTVPTTSTTGPGNLPQTSRLPSATDPQFLTRMSDLLSAVSSGDTAEGLPAFFPLGAYIQVKGISDPVHDYDTRLIPEYDQDIRALHEEMGQPTGTPALDHVYVPAAAEWVLPGVEYNKGSYWRVYDSRVYFRIGGELHYFSVASLISWRGEWYVVHLSSIR